MNKTLEALKNSDILALLDSEQVHIKGGRHCGDKRTPRPGGGTTSFTHDGSGNRNNNFEESRD